MSQGRICSILCAATLRLKLQIQLSISPSHSILTPGQPVPALTLQRQAPGRVATGVPIFKQPTNQPTNLDLKLASGDTLRFNTCVDRIETELLFCLITEKNKTTLQPGRVKNCSHTICRLLYQQTCLSLQIECRYRYRIFRANSDLSAHKCPLIVTIERLAHVTNFD